MTSLRNRTRLRRPATVRRAAAALGSALALLAGPAAAAPLPSGQSSVASLADRFCGLEDDQILWTWRGLKLPRSPDLVVVPEEGNFMSFGLSHAGPWHYLQHTPVFLYGPGHVKASGTLYKQVTLPDLTDTLAELIGSGFDAPDGEPMLEALVPAEERPVPPKLVVVVVWDAGGRNVLSQWPSAWPYLKSMQAEGAWYANATVGSAPSHTAAIHPNLGTGTFPRTHGMVDSPIRFPGGVMADPWSRGPATLLAPTLADVYDQEVGNEAMIANVSTLTWHIPMIGHGSQHPGGDKDLNMLHVKDAAMEWFLPASLKSFFTFPAEVNEVTGWEGDKQRLDMLDGVDDGRWRGHVINSLRGGFDTPARTPFQVRMVQRVISERGFGDDAIPDLLFTNQKIIDEIGHVDGIDSLEMKDTLAWSDDGLEQLVTYLDDHVGNGEYVLALTADHGHQLPPPAGGYFAIDAGELEADLLARFDGDGDGVSVVKRMRPTGIYVNKPELAQNGHALWQVAAWVNAYTKGANLSRRERHAAKIGWTGRGLPGIPGTAGPAQDESEAGTAGVPSSQLRASTLAEQLFAAAHPTASLGTLPCVQDVSGGGSA